MLGSPARAQSSDEPVEPAPPSSDVPQPAAPPDGPQPAAPPDVPQPAAPPAGFHEHDGFFIRAAIGPGLLHASWKVGTYDWSVTGTGFAIAVALGGSVTRNLVVYAELTRSVASDPTLTVKDVSTTKLTNYDVDLAGFGPGAAYYLAPANLYFSAALALSKLTSSYNGPSGSEGDGTALEIFTRTDIGGTVMVGKEWWASANWGLGVAAIGYLASMKRTNEDSRVTAEAFSIVLSATYN
jgi:hypothetical protein